MSITVVDMHTGGEPLRIVESGIPELQGKTLLEKRRDLIKNGENYRKFLMLEPRGHFDMYGVILCESDENTDCDFGVIFMHNSGYSSMCGHACIALGRYAIDFNKITRKSSKNELQQCQGTNKKGFVNINIQCPCGVVQVISEVFEGKSTGNVSFVSSPAWLELKDQVLFCFVFFCFVFLFFFVFFLKFVVFFCSFWQALTAQIHICTYAKKTCILQCHQLFCLKMFEEK